MQITKVDSQNSNFPQQLRDIPLPPKELYVLGEIGDRPMVAIVGSRKANRYGKQITYDFAYELAKAGVTIVSGLASGIDTEAHRGALDAGGHTIAVLAHGLDSVYPASNRALAIKILESGGALVSEYDKGTPPLKHHFIDRNRIISGLSLGTLVTQADTCSGSLWTVQHTIDQGRVLMAVPGQITDPMSSGPNNLIREFALAVVSSSDILAGVELGSHMLKNTQIAPASAVEAKILDAMAQGNTNGQNLIEATGMDASHFAQVISLMEITGKVRNLGAGNWIPRH